MVQRKDTPVAAVVAFTSTAEGADAPALDLNEYVVQHPNSTFYLKIEGDGMIEEGIHSGDVVAIDRSRDAKAGDYVVVADDGELILTKLRTGQDYEIWGAVSSVIRKYK